MKCLPMLLKKKQKPFSIVKYLTKVGFFLAFSIRSGVFSVENKGGDIETSQDSNPHGLDAGPECSSDIRSSENSFCRTPPMFSENTMTALSRAKAIGRTLSVTTWNIAAINNNPFEYWMTINNYPEYEKLMKDVESFIEYPGPDNDVPVNKIFTQDMFERLDSKMKAVAQWPSVDKFWQNDFQNRRIVSEFLKDGLLGSKRLASMPDRITNTINVFDVSEPKCRPTVINMYHRDLSNLSLWYDAWEKFMFTEPLQIETGEGVVEPRIPFQMLQPIKKAKYPDITEEEEKMSLPLQTLCGAIFDAILVHMMNTVSTPSVWQPLKSRIVDALIREKVPRTLNILNNVYDQSDIITLQEVSSAFTSKAAQSELGEKFHVISPENADPVRDQNSIILLKKDIFPGGTISEVTKMIESTFPTNAKVPVARGDILAITTNDKDGLKYLIASFHGDTNGLATKPVLDALLVAMKTNESLQDHILIFGLDANTYVEGKPGKKQGVKEFGDFFVSKGLTSCWGDSPNPYNFTTFNARTFLQPQLNKACKSSEKRKHGDVNPKDFIIFNKDIFKVLQTTKDNTGNKKYIEDMAFPTLDFPSDHGVLSTVLKFAGIGAQS